MKDPICFITNNKTTTSHHLGYMPEPHQLVMACQDLAIKTFKENEVAAGTPSLFERGVEFAQQTLNKDAPVLPDRTAAPVNYELWYKSDGFVHPSMNGKVSDYTRFDAGRVVPSDDVLSGGGKLLPETGRSATLSRTVFDRAISSALTP